MKIRPLKSLKKIIYLYKRFKFKIIFWYYKLLNAEVCKSFYGPSFVANYKDQTFKYYLLGTYGDFFSDFLVKEKLTDTFLDIGSNQGLYSLIAANNSKINKIHAFEPNKSIYGLLASNMRINNVGLKMAAYNVGISNKSAVVDLIIPAGHSGAGQIIENSSYNKELDKIIVEKIEVVDFSWLDSNIIIDKNAKVGVKIDVEGHEQIVIEALRNSKIWGRVIWLFFEVTPTKIDDDYVITNLLKEGFHTVEKIGKDLNQYDILIRKDCF